MGRFVIIQGHPDRAGGHLCHALADGYAASALALGHEVRRIEIAQMEFPILRDPKAFTDERPVESIVGAQRDIAWADRIAMFYPLWMGDVPALFKAFIEQTFRPGFAMSADGHGFPKPLFVGKSARIVVTMGMPATVYRTAFGMHTVKSLELNLRMCGVSPVNETLIGNVEASKKCIERRIAGVGRLAEFDARAHKTGSWSQIPLSALALGLSAYAASAALTWARFGRPGPQGSMLDSIMPEYDVRLHHDVTMHAGADVAYAAMCQMDFERSPIVRALFRLRQIFMRGGNNSRSQVRATTLREQLEAIGWSIIGEEPEKELVFGAVTQPWRSHPVFRGMPRRDFETFDMPGYAKIAVMFRVNAIDGDRSRAETETRVQITDRRSRERFRRYWSLVAPGAELIRIVLMRELKADAEARWRSGGYFAMQR